MKKLLFLFAAIALVSCNPQGLLDGIAVHVAMPQVTISTPSVGAGTYPLTKDVSVDSLNAATKAATGKTLDEATNIVLEGVTVAIITPDTLTFQPFSYAKLVVSAGSASVTVFDTPLSISSRSYPYTAPISIKSVIKAAREGDGKIKYSYTVTTNRPIPAATWRITSSVAVTP